MKKAQYIEVRLNTDPEKYGVGTYLTKSGDLDSEFEAANSVGVKNPVFGSDGTVTGERAAHLPEGGLAVHAGKVEKGKILNVDGKKIDEDLAHLDLDTKDGFPVVKYMVHTEETRAKTDEEAEKAEQKEDDKDVL